MRRKVFWGDCRGFVRERGASGRLLGEGGAPGKGRPLGATIHVFGIDKTMSASSTYGDFYRCHLPALVCYLSSDKNFASHTGQMSSLFWACDLTCADWW